MCDLSECGGRVAGNMSNSARIPDDILFECRFHERTRHRPHSGYACTNGGLSNLIRDIHVEYLHACARSGNMHVGILHVCPELVLTALRLYMHIPNGDVVSLYVGFVVSGSMLVRTPSMPLYSCNYRDTVVNVLVHMSS